MSAGAFSDDEVVKAAQKIVCVFVDCDWGKKNEDLSDKFKIRGYPTCVFTDPEGKEVARLSSRSAEGVIKQINEVVEKHSRAPDWQESWAKAAEKAKEDKKPVVCFFTTPKDDSKKLEEAITHPSMKDMRDKFVWVKSAIKKDSEDAKKFKVATSTQPVLFILDPSAEKPEEAPLAKISGKKAAKDLLKEFEAVLKKFDQK